MFLYRVSSLRTRKYQRYSLPFALITLFICKISEERIKGKQNSSQQSQTRFFTVLCSLVAYYRNDEIDTFVYSPSEREILHFSKAMSGRGGEEKFELIISTYI